MSTRWRWLCIPVMVWEFECYMRSCLCNWQCYIYILYPPQASTSVHNIFESSKVDSIDGSCRHGLLYACHPKGARKIVIVQCHWSRHYEFSPTSPTSPAQGVSKRLRWKGGWYDWVVSPCTLWSLYLHLHSLFLYLNDGMMIKTQHSSLCCPLRQPSILNYSSINYCYNINNTMINQNDWLMKAMGPDIGCTAMWSTDMYDR